VKSARKYKPIESYSTSKSCVQIFLSRQ